MWHISCKHIHSKSKFMPLPTFQLTLWHQTDKVKLSLTWARIIRVWGNQFINSDSLMRHLFLISSHKNHHWEAPQVFQHVKCDERREDLAFVAHSVFLTDHWNIPVQITRWMTARSLPDMLDTLCCYLSFNRQLIGLLSGRYWESMLCRVTHSPDLIVFLEVDASVTRHWRLIGCFHMQKSCWKPYLCCKVEILI